MKTKNLFQYIGVLLLLSGEIAYGADNTKAIAYYKLGNFEQAKEMFRKNIASSDVNSAEAYYYLGQIFYRSGQSDSAKVCYAKGRAIDPGNALVAVGEAQLLLKSDRKQAEDLFEKLLSGKNKNDALLHLLVARAYFEAGVDGKEVYLKAAQEINDKLPDLFILQGDIAAAANDAGGACTKYEQAIYFGVKCEEAYLKEARIYDRISPAKAAETVSKLLAVDPQSALGHRQLAEVDFTMGRFADAALNYEQYIQLEPSLPTDDLVRYASILFYNKDFEKALIHVEKVLASDPDNIAMNRLKMYIGFSKDEKGDIEQAERFMKQFNRDEYIPLDYAFYGRILKANKRNKEAIAQFNTALAGDAAKSDLLKEIAGVYETDGNYEKAIENYLLYFKAAPQEVKAADYLYLGQDYYLAASALKSDSVRQRALYQSADSLFALVTVKSPTAAIGYFWRGRASSALDPETTAGLAKPYYEQAVSILEKDKKDPKKLIECYSYLGYYFYLKNDPAASLAMWNKVIELDPANDIAKKAIDGIGKKK